MDTKICKVCLINQPLSEFYKEKKREVWKTSCKSCERAKSAAYKLANLEKVRAGYRDYARKNADRQKANREKYVIEKKDRIAQKAKEYWSKPENRARKAANKRAHYQSNAHFRILDNCRTRIYKALKHNRKSQSTLDLIGCSLEQLRLHLESQFRDGMTWDNHGEWHIDHIKPCASFDLSKPDEQKKCFHYTNLQPLWAVENILKRDIY